MLNDGGTVEQRIETCITKDDVDTTKDYVDITANYADITKRDVQHQTRRKNH